MTSKDPFFSIITVVFNGEKYLEQTIQSVFDQSYKNFEYIIIDGGSADNTINIIKKYDRQIDHWVSEPDKGIYDAMNKGIKKAKGKYIGLINSDDFYEPDALETIKGEIIEYSEKDIFFGNMFIINEYLSKKKIQTYKKGKKLNKKFSVWHPTVFVKKDVYDTYGLFDLSYKIAADYELILRFYKNKCSLHYINKAISNFREGGLSYYNKSISDERYRLQLAHTSFINAFINKIKFKLTEFFQKVFKFLLGEKKYHNLRYKFLYD